jgi:hypothetical protein
LRNVACCARAGIAPTSAAPPKPTRLRWNFQPIAVILGSSGGFVLLLLGATTMWRLPQRKSVDSSMWESPMPVAQPPVRSTRSGRRNSGVAIDGRRVPIFV